MKYDRYMNGPVIRRIRKDRNLTLNQVSYETGISVSTLEHVEQGERNLTLTTMFALMNVFDVDANTLLELDERKLIKVNSIDARLEELPKAQREYLTNTFTFMINQYQQMAS